MSLVILCGFALGREGRQESFLPVSSSFFSKCTAFGKIIWSYVLNIDPNIFANFIMYSRCITHYIHMHLHTHFNINPHTSSKSSKQNSRLFKGSAKPDQHDIFVEGANVVVATNDPRSAYGSSSFFHIVIYFPFTSFYKSGGATAAPLFDP